MIDAKKVQNQLQEMVDIMEANDPVKFESEIIKAKLHIKNLEAEL